MEGVYQSLQFTLKCKKKVTFMGRARYRIKQIWQKCDL